MFKAIVAAGEQLSEAKDVRAVVLSGNGRGFCAGLDMRIASPDTKMSIMEIKWGLIPDMSISQTLRDIVPLDVAKELTLTGRVLNGEEAQKIGLVTKVVEDPLAHALDIANEIASKSPDAIRAGKQLLDTIWHAD